MSKKKGHKVDKNFLLSYLWYEIIRMGFSPVGKDQRTWICMLQHTLYDFWGIKDSIPITETPSFPKFNIKFPSIGENKEILFECQIDDLNKKFTIKVRINNSLRWVHHYDGKDFSPSVHHLLNGSISRKSILKNVKQEDIATVIKGLLIHPCVHQHVNDAPESIEHEIRIGGGITNSFLYLFHLRYQLCPPNIGRREAELNWLSELFYSAIQSNRDTVSAKELMTIPKI